MNIIFISMPVVLRVVIIVDLSVCFCYGNFNIIYKKVSEINRKLNATKFELTRQY